MSRAEFQSFKRRALQYAVADGNLFWRVGKTLLQRVIIDSDVCKAETLKELHEEFGHKDRESTLIEGLRTSITGVIVIRMSRISFIAAIGVNFGTLAVLRKLYAQPSRVLV
jgi:hypothetical protein